MTTPQGVYAGNSVAKVQAFEQWLGKKADVVLTHLGIESWKDFVGSVAHLSRDVWSNVESPVVWSLPLNVKGTALEDAAAGDFNSYYRTAAEWIDRYSASDKIYVRPGWEFNGYWMPWSAEGKEQAFIDAFRQMVDTFRSVSDRFVFEWTVNIGDFGMDPADAYPGDSYVDIVGMDFYHNPAWDPADPLRAWHQMANREYGLEWLEDFASAHGKPTAYSEWGVMTDNMQPYLDLVADWFESHDVAYQIYWDANAGGYTGKLSEGTNPNTGSAFRDLFTKPAQLDNPGQIENAVSNAIPGIGGNDQVVGDTGNNTLDAGDGRDFVNGGHGNDLIDGGTGEDELWGLPGNDTIRGGDGIDRLFGNDGRDFLYGGSGNDHAQGGAGNDQVTGDSGHDALRGGDGRDYMNGGHGNDVLDGGTGDDELWALPGNDAVYGGAGADRLFGNEGDDRLSGGGGKDVLDGGAGQDKAAFEGNASAFRIQATSSAGQWKVTEIANGEFDLVTNIELFTFLDTTIRADSLV
jgi:Ca2+-binding RTX toxin-like protein